MKKQTLYVCELCHTSYADEEKAKECEAHHKLLYPKTQIEARYNSSNQYGCPTMLIANFQDQDNNKVYIAKYSFNCVEIRPLPKRSK